jgi:uncharacterized protein YndB with AHSA1/START domain
METKETLKMDVADREVRLTRIIDGPRELVYRAWTNQNHLAQWWGPNGFTNPVCQINLRPGGAWRIVMRSPEGIEYPIKGVYREIVEPERLVFTDNWEEHAAEWQKLLPQDKKDAPTQEALNTVTFKDHGDQTKLTICIRFDSNAVRDAMVKMGMSDGWGQSLDRLEEFVAN